MKTYYVKHLFVTLVALACVAGLAACNSSAESSGDAEAASENGVAAVVNGVDIMEDEVTEYIQGFRAQYEYGDDDSWGTYLAQAGMTPETLREQVITNYFAARELVLMAAEEEGISVTDEEVDEQVAKMRANYADDEAWNNALEQAGTTEEEYLASVRENMIANRLEEKIVSQVEEVGDDELLENVQMYAAAFTGAKRSSHILFNADDKATAEDVLQQLKDGSITFEDAAAEYSQDGSGSEGGDVGWDMLSSFVTEYQEGLDALDEGEMSDLVESQYGYHIIKCTSVFTAPENPEDITSLDQVPDALVDYLRSMLQSSAESNAYTEWLNDYEEKSEIAINPMPEGLPYDIDMAPYEAAAAAAVDDSEAISLDDLEVEETDEDVEAEGAEDDVAAGEAEDTPAEDDVDAGSATPSQPTEVASDVEGEADESEADEAA